MLNYGNKKLIKINSNNKYNLSDFRMAAAKESIPATGPSIPNIRKFKGKIIAQLFPLKFIILTVDWTEHRPDNSTTLIVPERRNIILVK